MTKLDNPGDLEANSATMDTPEQNSTPNPRDDIASRFEQKRLEELKESGEQIDLDAAGTESIRPMHEEGEEDDSEKLEIDLSENKDEQENKPKPIEDFIEYDDDGTPMMKMIIDGEEELVPLDQARVLTQKSSAVSKRFEEVSQWAQDLNQREERLKAREAELANAGSLPPEGVDDLDEDEDYLEDIRGAVDEILHGDEDDATEALAKVLARRGVNSDRAAIDVEELATKVTESVERKREEREHELAMAEGFNAFKDKFSDNIMLDEDLYDFANRKSTQIAEANPDWTPKRVMLEAGKVTLEKFGIDYVDDEEDPEPSPSNDRQSQKENLVPMPNKRSAVTEPAPEEEVQTPQDVINDIRRQRGQA